MGEKINIFRRAPAPLVDEIVVSVGEVNARRSENGGIVLYFGGAWTLPALLRESQIDDVITALTGLKSEIERSR